MSKFTKGLNKDVDPVSQPEGTYRDLTGGVLNKELGTITNEKGTQVLTNSINGEILGTVYISEQNVVVFGYDSSNSASYIKSVNLNTGDITSYNVDSVLDFSNSDYVDATYSINNQGDTILYWTDGVNQPSFYNITQNKTVSNEKNISLFPKYDSQVNFTLNSITSGGSLNAGTYYLSFAYIDEDGTLTDYFYVTKPLPILGSDGRGRDKQVSTGKAIEFTLSNLDTSYRSIRVTAIRGTEAANITDIPISNGSISYTYSGSENDTVGSIDEIVINSAVYKKANTLKSYNNQLYLGGLENQELNRSEKEKLQAVALNANIKATTSNENNDFYKGVDNQFDKKTYKRGEVYAFYVSFIKSNGKETDAFHIPGRVAVDNTGDSGNDSELQSESLDTISGDFYQFYSYPDDTYNMGYWRNNGENYPDVAPFNQEDFQDINGNTQTYAGTPVRHHRFPEAKRNNSNGLGRSIDESSGSNPNIRPLKIELLNLNINDSELISKIDGWKLYYSKKGVNNKVIASQGSIQPGWLDKVVIQNNSQASFGRLDIDSGPDQDRTITVYPFGSGVSRSYDISIPSSYTKNDVANKIADNVDSTSNTNSNNIDATAFIDVNGETWVEFYWLDEDTKDKWVGNSPDLGNAGAISFTSDAWVEAQGFVAQRPEQGYDGIGEINEIFKDEIYTTHGFIEGIEHDANDDGSYTTMRWGAIEKVGYVRPPKLMISRENISGINFITHQFNINTTFRSSGKSQRIVEIDNYTDNVNDPFEVKNRSYIDKNQRNISLTSSGFDYDMDNIFGESKIILESNDTNMTSRGDRIISDLCQLKNNVHVPFTNQELIDTGYSGSIDSNGSFQNTTNIYGGDIYIGKNYYKANSLISVYNIDDTNPNWNENDDGSFYTENSFRKWFLDDLHFSIFEDDDSNNTGSDGENIGARSAILEEMNTDGGDLIGVPVPHGFMYEEIIESRINPYTLYSGAGEYEKIYPQNGITESVVWPEISSLQTNIDNAEEDARIQMKKWCQYFKNSDNYPKWNESYEESADIKSSFPWNPNEIIKTNNFNRIVRSSGDEESGRSQSFRRFRENDFDDVKRNRGEIINIEELDNNLIIHLEKSLIQTRGRERMRTEEGQDVFIGSGDIFKVDPDEIMSTNVGFGGLQNITSSIKTESGYFWIDLESQSVYNISKASGIKDLSSDNFGLNSYFKSNLSGSGAHELGYDPELDRLLLTNNIVSYTLSFYPSLGAWVSFHQFKPDKYIPSREQLYTYANENVYEHNEFLDQIYDNDKQLNLQFAVPHGINNKVNFAWFNADEEGTNNIPFDWIRINNEDQDTGQITLTPYSSDPTDITSRGNCRKHQGVWKVNNIRVTDGSGNLPNWAYERKLEDDYHIVELNAQDKEIRVRAAGLDTERSIR